MPKTSLPPKNLGPLDKLQIALDLKKRYGSLHKGCLEEGLPYSKLADWYSLRKLSHKVKKAVTHKEKVSDSPKLELSLRKLKEVSRFPKEQQMKVAKEIQGKDDIETRRYLRQAKMEAAPMPIIVEVSSKAFRILTERAKETGVKVEEYCSQILERSVTDNRG